MSGTELVEGSVSAVARKISGTRTRNTVLPAVSDEAVQGGMGIDVPDELVVVKVAQVTVETRISAVGTCTPLINTFVVEMKFVPDRNTSWNTEPRAPVFGPIEVSVGSVAVTRVTTAVAVCVESKTEVAVTVAVVEVTAVGTGAV
jgi:hypothetical protein